MNTLAMNLKKAVNAYPQPVIFVEPPFNREKAALISKASNYLINNLNISCFDVPCNNIISMPAFLWVDEMITSKMIAYAAADIRGASQGNILFSFARQQLHEWRKLFDGCVWVNGELESIEVVDYD